MDESANFPGAFGSSNDGHDDVIDTEIVSMSLIGAVTLTAGLGQGGVDTPSPGVIVEQAGDPEFADSIFEVFFEVDLGGGSFAYNHVPLQISAVIDRVPPGVTYLHPMAICIDLFDRPPSAPGVPILLARLIEAQHTSIPNCPAIGPWGWFALSGTLLTLGLYFILRRTSLSIRM